MAHVRPGVTSGLAFDGFSHDSEDLGAQAELVPCSSGVAEVPLPVQTAPDWGAVAGADGILKATATVRPPVARVWDPPVWWEALSREENLPKAVREISATDLEGLGLCSFTPSRDPSWMRGRRGKKALAWFDPALTGPQIATAERLLFRMLDNQYGPPGPGGALVRPNFVCELPLSLKGVPF